MIIITGIYKPTATHFVFLENIIHRILWTEMQSKTVHLQYTVLLHNNVTEPKNILLSKYSAYSLSEERITSALCRVLELDWTTSCHHFQWI
jgi:hypothetical protein